MARSFIFLPIKKFQRKALSCIWRKCISLCYFEKSSSWFLLFGKCKSLSTITMRSLTCFFYPFSCNIYLHAFRFVIPCIRISEVTLFYASIYYHSYTFIVRIFKNFTHTIARERERIIIIFPSLKCFSSGRLWFTAWSTQTSVLFK